MSQQLVKVLTTTLGRIYTDEFTTQVATKFRLQYPRAARCSSINELETIPQAPVT
jgi:hypothetical protein